MIPLDNKQRKDKDLCKECIYDQFGGCNKTSCPFEIILRDAKRNPNKNISKEGTLL